MSAMLPRAEAQQGARAPQGTVDITMRRPTRPCLQNEWTRLDGSRFFLTEQIGLR